MNKKTKISTSKNNFATHWINFVLKHKIAFVVFPVLFAFGMAINSKIEFNGDYHAFFKGTNPELIAFDDLQEKYTKDDLILIALAPKDKNIFTKNNLSAIEELTEMAWTMPFSSRVNSLTNYQHTRAEGDNLYVEDLCYEALSKSEEQIDEIKKIALSESILLNRVINEKGSVSGISIIFKIPDGYHTDNIVHLMNSYNSMVDDFKKKYPNIDVYTTGNIPLNLSFYEHSVKDMGLAGVMVIAVMLITGVLTRNVFAMISTFFVYLLSLISTTGFIGLMNIQLTGPSSIFPTVILTLAVADSIHILVTYLQKLKSKNYSKHDALKESLRLNFMPVFITSLTTALGFLTLNFSEVPPFNDLGNVVAFGMTMAFVYSTTFLPALMSIFPHRKKQKESDKLIRQWYTNFGEWVVKQPIRLTIISSIVIIALGYLSSFNILNDEFVEYFDESVEFRNHSDYVNDNLTGFYNMEFSISSGESGGISNPEYLKKLEEFKSWFKQQPHVVHVNSFSEVTTRLNKSMHGDNPAYLKIPDSREEAAQYLLLYELSLPFGLDLNNQINVDKSETRFTVTLENISSRELLKLSKRAQSWLTNNTEKHMHSIAAGIPLMFSNLGFRQANAMLKGNILALLIISIILIIALRSLKLGLLSIIPNVTPIIVGFGIWALYSGTINVGMVVVFGLTMGIIVDDTVHFMSKFLRAKREYGYDTKKAVIYSFETVGKALVTTTTVLLIGFAILSTSAFAINSHMAKITLIIIFSALVIDFILLPSLLILTSNDKK